VNVVFVLIAALLAALAVASFFLRRHAESDAPEPGWRETSELFRDPSSGRLMRVWIDDHGGRHYVPEGRLGPEP
jgi:hypothetical protein